MPPFPRPTSLACLRTTPLDAHATPSLHLQRCQQGSSGYRPIPRVPSGLVRQQGVDVLPGVPKDEFGSKEASSGASASPGFEAPSVPLDVPRLLRAT